jgi:acyl-CoA synthetase (AMP-forming)/AMP-acid ligase II
MRLHDMVEFHGRVRGDSVALRDGQRAWTHGELDEASNRVAGLLGAAGLGAGDRVSMLAANCLEYYAMYFGASKAGCVMVPLNERLAPPEWAYILNDSGSRLVVGRGELAAGLQSIRSELESVTDFLAIGPGPEGWGSWTDELAAAPPRVEVDPPLASADPAVQMYTSGTTGRPKGAVLSHGALTASIHQSSRTQVAITSGCMHIVAPLAHIGSALSSMIYLDAGGSVFVQETFDMEEVVRILDEEGVNSTMLVPAMIQALLVFVPDAADRSYESLGQIGYGASAIAPEVLRQAMDVFGCEFAQGYGCTESSGGLTIFTPADHRRALDENPELLKSAGRRAFGTDVRVIDPDGADCAPGEVGEIIARGPQLMTEYWNMPEATTAALRDGWLYTGDAGTFDDEGYLFIRDRIKDMIVSGGENVYPAEVEQILFEHPAVADVAVIGIPDDKWGEAVKACVVLKPDESASDAELIGFCRERLAGFKLPKSVDLLDELPRNASMKVLKTVLREPYWADRERGVS